MSSQDMEVFAVRPFEDQCTYAFIEGEFIAIWWMERTPLDRVADLDDAEAWDYLQDLYQQDRPGEPQQHYNSNVAQMRQFLKRAVPGTALIMALPNGKVAIGRVSGEYVYVPPIQLQAKACRWPHRRAVEWLSVDIPLESLSEPLQAAITKTPRRFFQISENAAEVLDLFE